MPRGRKSLPTTLKVINGNPGKRALNRREPMVKEPLCQPPEDWAEEAKDCWRNVASQIPKGVATRADTILVEILVRLVGRVRYDPETLTPAMAAQIRACCSELGMSPSARARLSIGADERPSKFHGLLGGTM